MDFVAYSVRYVHQIHPSAKDVGNDIVLSKKDLVDLKSLAAALRRNGTLAAGGRLKGARMENGRIVVFPSAPGLTTYWHSIILTPQ